ncbi:MAG TPA: type II toxin-antitoxin system Y4mF family antitoxin [Bacilli bacterium]|jgi:y4mF family transcriptional regulator|nr:type II toxin-antitoxin system Y4mF family antitoxin [Bacilli bacterium]HQD91852.1 type II toxin-antitoxin system Y4mF family antitoxin [Bacilli bacterium]
MEMKELGRLIKERRKNLGLTQAYLAALSNTGIRFIIELEAGKPTVQVNKVLDVLNVLNLKVEIKVNE